MLVPGHAPTGACPQPRRGGNERPERLSPSTKVPCLFLRLARPGGRETRGSRPPLAALAGKIDVEMSRVYPTPETQLFLRRHSGTKPESKGNAGATMTDKSSSTEGRNSSNIVNVIRVALYLIAAAFFLFAVLMFIPVFGGGMVAAWNSQADIKAKGQEIAAKHIDEDTYNTVCPKYLEANIILKMTTLRDKAWCEEWPKYH